jgi:hypothetical protein
MAEEQRPPNGPKSLSQIQEEWNFMESILADISPQDELLAEVVRTNQMALEQQAAEGRFSGMVIDEETDDGGAFSNPSRSALPQDAVGTLARDINPNDTGPAVFQVRGTVFYSIVRNTDKEELQAGTSVRVLGSGNRVTARGAAGNIAGLGSAGGGNFFRYQGRLYRVPQVTEDEETVKVANQLYIRENRTDVDADLDPGEEKEFARIEPDANKFALLKYTNATAHSTVSYDYYIDDPSNPDPDLSGSTPWATPPDLFEVSPGGFRLVEDFASLKLRETSGSNSYSNVQGTLTALLFEVNL